eukprot:878437-Pyramimonas_sp.AAC.1
MTYTAGRQRTIRWQFMGASRAILLALANRREAARVDADWRYIDATSTLNRRCFIDYQALAHAN